MQNTGLNPHASSEALQNVRVKGGSMARTTDAERGNQKIEPSRCTQDQKGREEEREKRRRKRKQPLFQGARNPTPCGWSRPITREYTGVDCDAATDRAGRTWDIRGLRRDRGGRIQSLSGDGLRHGHRPPVVAAGAACGQRHKRPFPH